MSLCSFISQLPINPKLSATQPTVNKQHWKEVMVVVWGGGDAIVPSQHLPKDSATLRSYTLMSYCKLVSWEKNAPTVVSMAKRYQPLSFMS